MTFDQVAIVIEETLSNQELSQEKGGKTRSESFDIQGLEEEFEGDEETKRLKEDVMIDKFKLIEKFLSYWLPESTKH